MCGTTFPDHKRRPDRRVQHTTLLLRVSATMIAEWMGRTSGVIAKIPDDVRIVVFGVVMILIGWMLQSWTAQPAFSSLVWVQGVLLIWQVVQKMLFKKLLLNSTEDATQSLAAYTATRASDTPQNLRDGSA